MCRQNLLACAFPSFALELLLSLMAGSKETVKIFLADKLLAGFAVGVVNFGSIGCLLDLES